MSTLGALALTGEDGATISAGQTALVVLAYLARHAPGAVTRAELTSLLGGDQAAAGALDELAALLGPRLERSGDAARLDPRALALDVDAFEHDVDAGRDREAIARWRGDFLPAAAEGATPTLRAWIEAERAALHHRLSTAFARLVDEAERRGAAEEATQLARRWSTLAPSEDRTAPRRRSGGGTPAPIAAVSRVEPTQRPSERRPRSDSFSSDLPLVGRARALGLLHAGWRSARAGAATVVTLLADRGMGASRLCEQLAR
ncbi:MAG TPA: hypothetical protein VEA99_05000, partial [Gemmatimonadaceae bacterium]|nr:hypothetical protein [Gemmatimonadaceae bacterium]